MRLFEGCLIAMLGLAAAGCSGGGGSTGPASDLQLVPRVVAGRLAPGVTLPEARVTVQGAGGVQVEVPELRTDAAGNFLLGPLPLPPNFRLTLIPTGALPGPVDDAPLMAEVEGHGAGFGMIPVNAATHLVAEYHRAHPELTLSACEARVRSFLALAPNLDLGWEVDNPGSGFSHDVFFQQAQAHGGLAAFTALLVGEMDAGATHPMILAEQSFWGRLFDNTVADLTAGFTTDLLTFGIGKIAGCLGFNFGEAAQLRQISQELQEISTQIGVLQQEVATNAAAGTALAAYNQLESDINPMVGPNQQLVNEGKAAATTGVPLQTLPPGVSALLTALSNLSATSAIENMGRHLMDPGNPDNVFTALMVLQQTRAGGGGAAPVLQSDPLLGPVTSAYNYYAGWMAQAVNLLSETAYSPQSGQLAEPLVQAAIEIRRADQFTKGWLLQFPDQAGQIFVDREKGRMYYLQVQAPSNWFTIALLQSCEKPGFMGFMDWEIATQASVQRLYDLLKFTGDPFGNLGNVLGFDMSAFPSTTHKLWLAYSDVTTNCSYGASSIGTEPPTFNLADGTVKTKGNSPYDNNCYMWMRKYPAGPQDTSSAMLRALGTLTAVSANGSNPTQLAATGSFTITSGYGTASGSTDITDRVVWTSSNPAVADVSNRPGSEGQVTWRRTATGDMPGPVIFVASTFPVDVDSSGNVTPRVAGTLTSTVAVNPPDLSPRTVANLDVTPMNLVVTGVLPQQRQFYATSFGSDGFIADVTNDPNTVFSVTDLSGNPIPAAQVKVFQDTPGLLEFEPALTTADLILEVTYSLNGTPTTTQTRLHVPVN